MRKEDEAVGRLHVMSSSHEKAREESWGESMDVEEAVGRLHVMNSSHVMNSLHEKAREDWLGEPKDAEEGNVGLPVTLPLPWVGGSCDGGDEGEETLQSLPRWVMA